MRGPIFCYCKIVSGKIVHCALHDNATYLVGVCEHIYALLRELVAASLPPGSAICISTCQGTPRAMFAQYARLAMERLMWGLAA